MSANDRCAVRRCRHPRSAHVPETVSYISIGGFPASFKAHGRCTVQGCTCNQFSVVNSLQPTRPCRKCGEEYLAEAGKTTCPECSREYSGEPADVFAAFNRFARDYALAAQEDERMSTHREDPWAHGPEVCPSSGCPGCHAEAYVPRDRWGEDTGRAVLGAFYDNGDRAEDTERGIASDSGNAFYSGDGG